MWSDTWVAIDTETTGFSKSSRILELGCVTFEGQVEVRRWSTLLSVTDIDWRDAKVQEALAINGIHPDDLRGKPTFADVFHDLLLELSVPVWVGHNLAFDIRMLQQEVARIGRPALAMPNFQVCTKTLAQRHFGKGNNRLTDLACQYNIIPTSYHRADEDAFTAGAVLARMRDQGHVPLSDEGMRALCGGGVKEQYKHVP